VPKIFGKELPTWMVVSGGVLGLYLVYTTVFPGDAPVAPTAKKPVAKKKDANDIYLPEDHKVRFASFTEPVKDSFKPLVAKSLPSVGAVNNNPGGISQAWANGEANWAYTGYMSVNGAPQGLLEKSDTGEGDYVSVGQKWKLSTITKITPEAITISAPDGPHEVKLGDTSEQKEKAAVIPGRVPPFNPAALQGQIGGPGLALGAQPGDLAVTPDPNAFPAFQQGGRRNRGNRGGGGGRGGRGGGGGGFGGG